MLSLIEYSLTCFLGFLARLLPIPAAFWTARRMADLSFIILSKRRHVAYSNIEKAFPDISKKEKNKIARSAFRNAALAIVELFVVDKMIQQSKIRFKLLNNEHLEKAFGQGKGAILVISHLGSWEYLAFLPLITKQHWSVVVKKIKNPYVNQMVDNLRRKMTLQPIMKSGAVKTILKELRNNHGVAILIDQWAGNEGVWMDFFGVSTSTTTMPARLAKRTGAVLVPAYCLRVQNDCYEIHIEEPVPFDSNAPDWELATTKKLDQLLENKIRQFPDQWLWGHRRWKKMPASLRAVK